MTPETLVQEQLDAYNAHDLVRFVAAYDDNIECFRPPSTEPFIKGKDALAAHYGSKRFNLPQLHAKLLHRIVLGNKVIDHELISGLNDTPLEAAVTFEIENDLIRRAWFF